MLKWTIIFVLLALIGGYILGVGMVKNKNTHIIIGIELIFISGLIPMLYGIYYLLKLY